MRTKIGLVYLILTIMLLSGCGMAGLPFTGQVTDAETGEPIEEVIIVALWKGDVNPIVDSTQICYHIETSVSDQNGEYRIPGWVGGKFGVMGGYIVIEAYKRGYERVPVNKRDVTDEIKMTLFTEGIEARLDQLARLIGPICDSDNGDSLKKLIGLSKNVYSEAEELVLTRAGYKKRLDWMQYQLEILMFGLDEADRLWLDRNKR